MSDNRMLQMHLHQLEQRFEADCSAAESRILRARTMAEVVRATEVSVRPELRAMSRHYPGYRRMKSTAERRLEQLLKEQLEAMKALPLAEAEALFSRYRRQDWQSLRGTYASLYQRGDRAGQRLLHDLRGAASPT